MDSDTGEWRTYRQVASALHVSVEAARRRALRGNWRRTLSNAGKTLVIIPEGVVTDASPPRAPDVRPDVTHDNTQVISALEAHVTTLREQLAATEARLGEAGEREGRLVVELEAERARTSKAIEAFSDLADRLDQFAAANQQRRPWWRRLAG
jgi:hypothetical protein